MSPIEAAPSPGAAVGMVDARPIRATSSDTIWDRAVSERDRFAAVVRATLEREQMDALVVVSQNGNYPPWVKLEAWLPTRRGGASERERAELELIVDAKPYHEHPLIHTARLSRGRRSIAVHARPEFTAEHVRQWTLYALGKGGKPGNYTPVIDALVGLLVSFIPFVPRPHSNRIESRFRNLFSLTGAKVLAIASVALIWFGLSLAAQSPLGMLVILVALAGLIATAVIAHRRKHLVSAPAQPAVAPRNLGLVDSWHTVVVGLAADADPMKQRLQQRLAESDGLGLDCRPESYSYRTPGGYEERERLVVTRGQCLVHVHVYPFGDDVFIGWHAYLNWAKWDESTPVSSRVAQGSLTEFRALRPGYYVPNQFDLIDLSSLSEFVHRRIERELKRLLKEKSIDQEIDFQIIRGDRDRALDRSRHASDMPAARGGGIWRRLSAAAAPWQARSETEIARTAEAPDATQSRGLGASRASAAVVLPGIVVLGLVALIAWTLATGEAASDPIAALGTSISGILIPATYAIAIALGLRRYAQAPVLGVAVSIIILLSIWFALPFLYRSLTEAFFGGAPPSDQLTRVLLPLLGYGIPLAAGMFLSMALQARALRSAGRFVVFVVGWIALSGLTSFLYPLAAEALGADTIWMRILISQSLTTVSHLPMFALLGFWLQRGAEARPR